MEYKFKIAVCDAERSYADAIRDSVAAYMEQHNIPFQIEVFETEEKLFDIYKKGCSYVAVFIGMENAIAIGRKIIKRKPETFLILMGNSFSDSIEGYKIGGFRYVLKENPDFNSEIYEITKAVVDNYKADSRLELNGIKSEVSLDEIMYIESRLHLAEFHLNRNEEKYNVHEKLDEIEKEMQSDKFLRIHKSFLVNMEYIELVKNYRVLLYNGEQLPIPKTKYRYVKDKVTEYMATQKK